MYVTCFLFGNVFLFGVWGLREVLSGIGQATSGGSGSSRVDFHDHLLNWTWKVFLVWFVVAIIFRRRRSGDWRNGSCE